MTQVRLRGRARRSDWIQPATHLNRAELEDVAEAGEAANLPAEDRTVPEDGAEAVEEEEEEVVEEEEEEVVEEEEEEAVEEEEEEVSAPLTLVQLRAVEGDGTAEAIEAREAVDGSEAEATTSKTLTVFFFLK
jgi:hypothetical protein